jgi:ADYC domain
LSNRPAFPLYALACCALAAACGSQQGTPESRATFDASPAPLNEPNGRNANGPALNGRNANGTALDGVYVLSTSLSGATAGGAALTGTSLAKGSFTATTAAKKVLTGVGFTGVTFTASLSNGGTLPLTIASAALLPSPNADIVGYAVAYPNGTGSAPLCGLELDGTPVLAVAVAGWFNYGQGVAGGGSYTASSSLFTFACRHFAVGKCVEYGYAPWKLAPTTTAASIVTLQNAWVACTRMLRADYCGNGTPATVDGTIIDIYDRYNVNRQATTWPVEAEWSPDGASCMNAAVSLRYVLAGQPVPSCYAAKASLTCGTFTSASTLLIDRYLF